MTSTLRVACFLIAFGSYAQAATYYVATNGSDVNSGTSTSLPWRSLNRVASGINTGAIVGGDTVFIRGGIYRERVVLTNNPTPSNPTNFVRIFSYTNESPTLRGSTTVANWTLYSGGATSIWKVTNWTHNSQQVFADGQPLAQRGWPNTSLAYVVYGCTNATNNSYSCGPYNDAISSNNTECWIYIPKGYSCSDFDPVEHTIHIGNEVTNMTPFSFYLSRADSTLYVSLGTNSPTNSLMEITTNEVLFSTGGGLWLKGLTFQHNGWLATDSHRPDSAGVILYGENRIEDCTISWCDTAGLALSGNNNKAIRCRVENNGLMGIVWNRYTNNLVQACGIFSNNIKEFALGKSGAIRVIPDGSGIVESNEVAYNLCSGIWFDTCNTGGQIIVRNNFIHHNQPFETRPGDTTPFYDTKGIFIEISRNADVYNNLVVSNKTYGIYNSGSRDVRFFNNTVAFTPAEGSKAAIKVAGAKDPFIVSNMVLRNNLLYNNYDNYGMFLEATNSSTVIHISSDYNAYYPFSKNTMGVGVVSTFSVWQAASGYDAHSITSNPLLRNLGSTILLPTPRSPIVNRGTNLSIVATDIHGVTRPYGSSHDIGVYEYDPRVDTTPIDFDGDAISDLGLFRTNIFNVLWSSTLTSQTVVLGTTAATNVPGDYDGDSITDYATFSRTDRLWRIIYSGLGTTGTFVLGTIGTVSNFPIQADYDGDGITDIATYSASSIWESTWRIVKSSDGTTNSYTYANPSMRLAPADYDGDGKADSAMCDTNFVWWITESSSGSLRTQQWGSLSLGDVPVPADYDNDRKADIAVWRKSFPQTYYIIRSSDGNPLTYAWGTTNDVPLIGDYDGDGQSDLGVYRPGPSSSTESNWFIIKSAGGVIYTRFWASNATAVGRSRY